jgi:hypothetical protein
MHPNAVSQAKVRLQKAEAALARLETAKQLAPIEEAWSDFLIASGGIYSKLEQGAKGFGKSAAWFGKRKKERKDDSLLSYLHHARNSDEHGIDHGVDTVHTSHVIWTKDAGGWVRQSTIHVSSEDDESDSRLSNEAKVTVYNDSGDEIESKVFITHSIKLLRVRDSRFGDSFEPPKTFLGDRVFDVTPLGVARLATPYLKRLILEAEALAL